MTDSTPAQPVELRTRGVIDLLMSRHDDATQATVNLRDEMAKVGSWLRENAATTPLGELHRVVQVLATDVGRLARAEDDAHDCLAVARATCEANGWPMPDAPVQPVEAAALAAVTRTDADPPGPARTDADGDEPDNGTEAAP